MEHNLPTLTDYNDTRLFLRIIPKDNKRIDPSDDDGKVLKLQNGRAVEELSEAQNRSREQTRDGNGYIKVSAFLKTISLVNALYQQDSAKCLLRFGFEYTLKVNDAIRFYNYVRDQYERGAFGKETSLEDLTVRQLFNSLFISLFKELALQLQQFDPDMARQDESTRQGIMRLFEELIRQRGADLNKAGLSFYQEAGITLLVENETDKLLLAHEKDNHRQMREALKPPVKEAPKPPAPLPPQSPTSHWLDRFELGSISPLIATTGLSLAVFNSLKDKATTVPGFFLAVGLPLTLLLTVITLYLLVRKRKNKLAVVAHFNSPRPRKVSKRQWRFRLGDFIAVSALALAYITFMLDRVSAEAQVGLVALPSGVAIMAALILYLSTRNRTETVTVPPVFPPIPVPPVEPSNKSEPPQELPKPEPVVAFELEVKDGLNPGRLRLTLDSKKIIECGLDNYGSDKLYFWASDNAARRWELSAPNPEAIKGVSKQHAHFKLEQGEVCVVSSSVEGAPNTNGVYIGGERMDDGESKGLREGDLLGFGPRGSGLNRPFCREGGVTLIIHRK
ncbi:MAG: FHA domain-containing protein [Chloroflexi bacterium]|uniref:FHA domain-containing protein n=1 Tax=Candidatus Chlorohelix allophototropha TaxID=3003348 RepID=A0A8T7M497_9CHLR|nr:FHA domain-containing protein [Chloroflexota bacterium]WJW70092.1 FHA domain-containing protein [Chloroflexota bacterium L227-S17]